MDAGRPLASRPTGPSLWVRRVAFALLGLAVLAAALPPLLLRGALLRWLVARETERLCGVLRLDDGRLGWLAVPDFLLGHPFSVELRGLHLAGPEGTEVLAAELVTADVEIARGPWRVVLDPVVVTHGRWRLAIDGKGGGFLGAFRALPAGAPRAACLAPAEPRRGPRPPPSDASLVLRSVRLDEVDVDLDFSEWGLALPRVRAMGSLALGTPGGSGFTFDVRNATAPGGVLRAGPGGAAATAATTTARFDDVAIAHVGVSPDEPGDLVLAVARADTGRSRLSGTAVFENVFAHHGRRGERNPPGLSLDARWERLTDAALRLEAGWLPRAALAEILDGTLAARVHGPFRALSGTVSIAGPRAGMEATLESGSRATLDARASDLALGPFLPVSLEPFFGGRATGRVRVSLDIVAGLADVDLEIPSAELELVRDAEPRQGPQRFVLLVGPSATKPPPSTNGRGDTLVLRLASARLIRRALRLEGVDARWAELSARGAFRLSLPPRQTDASTPSPPVSLDATATLGLTSLARWVAPETVSAHALAAGRLSGPLDHLRGRLAFAPSSGLTFLGERFRLPAPTTVTLDDGRLTLDRFVLAREGGGRVEAHGRIERTSVLSGGLRVADYPLAALPGMQTVALPGVLAKDGARTLGDALAGRLEADLTVRGQAASPDVSGTLTLTDVALAGHRIGDGHFQARSRGWSLALEGTLGEGLALAMAAKRRPDGVEVDASLKLDRFALAPWLPPLFDELALRASGDAHLSMAPGRPLASRAQVHLTGAGSDLEIGGTTSGDTATAMARGRVEVAGLRTLWRQALSEADGAFAIDLATAPHAPLKGSIVIARALSLRPIGWPLALGVAAGGRLDVDGTTLRVPSLTLTASGARLALAGDVRLDLDEPDRSALALTAKAQLDAAALARQAGLPALASAAGTITLDARAAGQVRAPVANGTARLDAVELRPASPAWPALRVSGVVDANTGGFSTRALRVETLGPALATGAVVVGAPNAPASVSLATTWPPRVLGVDVPVSGRGLRVGDAKSGFTIGALDLDLRLAGDPERELVLSGDVGVAGARFDPFAGKKGASGPARPWFEALPPWLTLDLTLHGPEDAVVVAVPVLPNLDLGLHCRVQGNARGGKIAGQLRGRGAYSRLMLWLFGPRGARECRVLKE